MIEFIIDFDRVFDVFLILSVFLGIFFIDLISSVIFFILDVKII